VFPFDDATRQALFYALPSALIVLALAVPWLARHGTQPLRRLHGALLALVGLLGFLLWTGQNWEKGRYFNPYEFFHYYVGSKYARELGYTRLYDAAVLVDRETGFAHRSNDLANLSAHRGGPEYKRLSAVYLEADSIRAAFTPERWAAFTRDVVYFRAELAQGMWEQLLHDKGYNATPAWTLVGGALANAIPIESSAGRAFLVALDPLLLAAGFGCIAWAFGARALGFAFALYFTHYCTSHAHFRAAFLRTDWVVALVAAVCCLKKERPFRAGALFAWATLSRVFPLLFAVGPAGVLVWSLWKRTALRTAALRFVAGGAVVGAALFAVTLPGGGLDAWREFQAKIVEHDKRPASDTVGFRKVFLWTVDFRQDQGPEMRALFEARKPWWWTLQALGALLVGALLRKRPLHEALCLSFAFVWFCAAPAYYYYAFLLVPLLDLAEQATRPAGALGLALVFGTSLCARAFHTGPTFGDHFAFKLSLVMGGLALYALASLAGRGDAQRVPADAR
jgi:energy-converting hydrogenase Eha subunit A